MSLRRFFKRSQEDAELAQLEAHLAHEIDDNLARGMSQEEAQRQAHLRLGSSPRVRETVWETNRVALLEDTWRDLRHAIRTLWNTPGFSVVAILVMAVAIGANTSLFTVVRSVLMKPLPFRDPDRLIQLYEQSPNGRRAYSYVAGGMYAAWKAQAPSVEQMAIYGTDSINLSGDSDQLPEKIRYAECSWNLFVTLGLNPEIGRFFVEAEDRPETGGTVVVTYSLWMRRYGGDR
jgi:putative ABC transport system permease protein